MAKDLRYGDITPLAFFDINYHLNICYSTICFPPSQFIQHKYMLSLLYAIHCARIWGAESISRQWSLPFGNKKLVNKTDINQLFP